MERITWLDESLAVNFDGTTEKLIENGKFLEIILSLKSNQELPKMSDLEFSKGNIRTEDYNGDDLFKIVGRYLIETKTQDELLKYVNDKSEVINDGNTILEVGLRYFSLCFTFWGLCGIICMSRVNLERNIFDWLVNLNSFSTNEMWLANQRYFLV